MSSNALPRHADLRKLAAASATVGGAVDVQALTRLLPLLLDTAGSVDVELRLGSDEEGYRTIRGRITASAVLQCQRCLGPVALDLDVPVSLAMVWAEKEIPSLPSRYEGVVVGEDPADLYDLVEEEMLLSLPLVAAHESGRCPSQPEAWEQNEDDVAAEPRRENPFAVLRDRGEGSGN